MNDQSLLDDISKFVNLQKRYLAIPYCRIPAKKPKKLSHGMQNAIICKVLMTYSDLTRNSSGVSGCALQCPF